MDKVKIGRKLTSLRKERGETAIDVANAIGISPSAIYMYESGIRIPRDEIKVELSKHFSVPVEEIFFANQLHG